MARMGGQRSWSVLWLDHGPQGDVHYRRVLGGGDGAQGVDFLRSMRAYAIERGT